MRFPRENNHLLCILFFPLLLQTGFPAMAQMEKDNLKTGLLLRGKVFGFVVFEDWWITSMNIGAEYRFARHHSFGVEYLFFKHRYEQEQYNNPSDPDDYVEYSEHNPRQALLLDYRFYIEPKWIQDRMFTPYLNLFSAVGKAKINHAAEWEFADNDVVNQKEKFYDLGAALGVRFCFDHERLGIDIGMGVARRTKTENVEYYITGGPNRFVEGHTFTEPRFIMRLAVFCYLFTKKYE